MPNITVTLQGASVQVVDNTTSDFAVNSPIGQIDLSGTSAVYTKYALFTTTPLALPLGAATIWVAYVKNLSATATLSVKPTPVAGGTPLNYVLPPGGVWLYWCPVETSGGLSGLTLTSSVVAPGSPAEVLVAY